MYVKERMDKIEKEIQEKEAEIKKDVKRKKELEKRKR